LLAGAAPPLQLVNHRAAAAVTEARLMAEINICTSLE